MEKGKMYPGIVVKLLDEPTQTKVSVLFDNGEEGIVNMLARDGSTLDSETMSNFFKDKAAIFVKDNNIRKMKEILQADKEYMASLSAKLMADNPEIMSDPVGMMSAINENVDKDANIKVTEANLIQKNSVIKLAGIAKEENGKIVVDSRCILFEGDSNQPSMSGTYMFAVNENKVPLKAYQENGFNKFRLSSQASLKQLDTYFKHNINTVKEFEKGTITVMPKPSIKVPDVEDFKKLPKVIQNSIMDINQKDVSAKDAIKALENLQEYINENISALDTIKFNMPIVERNLDIGEVKNSVIVAMMNTALRSQKFKYADSDTVDVEKIASDEFDKIVELEELELLTSYSPPNSNCGFFANNLNQGYILSSSNFDTLIDSINLTIKDIENGLISPDTDIKSNDNDVSK
jgi:hypothetical protein